MNYALQQINVIPTSLAKKTKLAFPLFFAELNKALAILASMPLIPAKSKGILSGILPWIAPSTAH